MKKIISILLLISIFALCFVSCSSDNGKVKLTKSEIEEALSSSEGTLETNGSSDNVTSFTFTMTDVSASKLGNKSYLKKAVTNLLYDSSSLTYGELKSARAFGALLAVYGLLKQDDESKNSYDTYVDELLEIICDNETKTYNNWSLSTSINTANDSFTIKAVSN